MKRGFLLTTGEVYLKGDNRRAFIRKLIANIKRLLTDSYPGFQIKNMVGKFFVSGFQHDESMRRRLCRVFGINQVEEVFVTSNDIFALERAAVEVMQLCGDGKGSFAVRTSRGWKGYAMNSSSVNAAVGEAVVKHLHFKVDLNNPDVLLRIRIEKHCAFLSVSTYEGAGGLPVGCEGRGLVLLSGGIDSPVAGYLSMKRGLEIEAVFFHSPPYTSVAALRKVRRLTSILAYYCGEIYLHILPFTDIQLFIKQEFPERYRVILYRWCMLKIAEKISHQRNIDVLITGESIGQVASQTVKNISCLDRATEIAVLRPLISYDKAETIKLARKIGTYDVSILPGQDCCSLFVPLHPVTNASLPLCIDAYREISSGGLIDSCVSKVVSEKIKGSID